MSHYNPDIWNTSGLMAFLQRAVEEYNSSNEKKEGFKHIPDSATSIQNLRDMTVPIKDIEGVYRAVQSLFNIKRKGFQKAGEQLLPFASNPEAIDFSDRESVKAFYEEMRVKFTEALRALSLYMEEYANQNPEEVEIQESPEQPVKDLEAELNKLSPEKNPKEVAKLQQAIDSGHAEQARGSLSIVQILNFLEVNSIRVAHILKNNMAKINNLLDVPLEEIDQERVIRALVPVAEEIGQAMRKGLGHDWSLHKPHSVNENGEQRAFSRDLNLIGADYKGATAGTSVENAFLYGKDSALDRIDAILSSSKFMIARMIEELSAKQELTQEGIAEWTRLMAKGLEDTKKLAIKKLKDSMTKQENMRAPGSKKLTQFPPTYFIREDGMNGRIKVVPAHVKAREEVGHEYEPLQKTEGAGYRAIVLDGLDKIFSVDRQKGTSSLKDLGAEFEHTKDLKALREEGDETSEHTLMSFGKLTLEPLYTQLEKTHEWIQRFDQSYADDVAEKCDEVINKNVGVVSQLKVAEKEFDKVAEQYVDALNHLNWGIKPPLSFDEYAKAVEEGDIPKYPDHTLEQGYNEHYGPEYAKALYSFKHNLRKALAVETSVDAKDFLELDEKAIKDLGIMVNRFGTMKPEVLKDDESHLFDDDAMETVKGIIDNVISASLALKQPLHEIAKFTKALAEDVEYITNKLPDTEAVEGLNDAFTRAMKDPMNRKLLRGSGSFEQAREVSQKGKAPKTAADRMKILDDLKAYVTDLQYATEESVDLLRGSGVFSHLSHTIENYDLQNKIDEKPLMAFFRHIALEYPKDTLTHFVAEADSVIKAFGEFKKAKGLVKRFESSIVRKIAKALEAEDVIKTTDVKAKKASDSNSPKEAAHTLLRRAALLIREGKVLDASSLIRKVAERVPLTSRKHQVPDLPKSLLVERPGDPVDRERQESLASVSKALQNSEKISKMVDQLLKKAEKVLEDFIKRGNGTVNHEDITYLYRLAEKIPSVEGRVSPDSVEQSRRELIEELQGLVQFSDEANDTESEVGGGSTHSDTEVEQSLSLEIYRSLKRLKTRLLDLFNRAHKSFSDAVKGSADVRKQVKEELGIGKDSSIKNDLSSAIQQAVQGSEHSFYTKQVSPSLDKKFQRHLEEMRKRGESTAVIGEASKLKSKEIEDMEKWSDLSAATVNSDKEGFDFDSFAKASAGILKSLGLDYSPSKNSGLFFVNKRYLDRIQSAIDSAMAELKEKGNKEGISELKEIEKEFQALRDKFPSPSRPFNLESGTLGKGQGSGDLVLIQTGVLNDLKRKINNIESLSEQREVKAPEDDKKFNSLLKDYEGIKKQIAKSEAFRSQALDTSKYDELLTEAKKEFSGPEEPAAEGNSPDYVGRIKRLEDNAFRSNLHKQVAKTGDTELEEAAKSPTTMSDLAISLSEGKVKPEYAKKILDAWPNKATSTILSSAAKLIDNKGSSSTYDRGAARAILKGASRYLKGGEGTSIKAAILDQLEKEKNSGAINDHAYGIGADLIENVKDDVSDSIAFLDHAYRTMDNNQLAANKDDLAKHERVLNAHMKSLHPSQKEDDASVYELAKKSIGDLKVQDETRGTSLKKQNLDDIIANNVGSLIKPPAKDNSQVVKQREDMIRKVKNAILDMSSYGGSDSYDNTIRAMSSESLSNRQIETLKNNILHYRGGSPQIPIFNESENLTKFAPRNTGAHEKGMGSLYLGQYKVKLDKDIREKTRALELSKQKDLDRGDVESEATAALESELTHLLEVSNSYQKYKGVKSPTDARRVAEKAIAFYGSHGKENERLVSGLNKIKNMMQQRNLGNEDPDVISALHKLGVTELPSDEEISKMQEEANTGIQKADAISNEFLGHPYTKVHTFGSRAPVLNTDMEAAGNTPTGKMKVSRYISEQAVDFLKGWMELLKQKGLQGAYHQKEFKDYLEAHKKKAMEQIKRSYSLGALEGFDIDGNHHKGEIEKLEEQKKYWESVLQNLEEESENIQDILVHQSKELMEIIKSNEAVSQGTRDVIEKHVTDHTELKNKHQLERTLAKNGLLLDEEGNVVPIPTNPEDMIKPLMDKLNIKHDIDTMPVAIFKNELKGLDGIVAYPDYDENSFSAVQKAILGKDNLDKLLEDPTNGWDILASIKESSPSLFTNWAQVAYIVKSKLEELESSKQDERSKITFTEPEKNLMGQTLTKKVTEFIEGKAGALPNYSEVIFSRMDKKEMAQKRAGSRIATGKSQYQTIVDRQMDKMKALMQEYHEKVDQLRAERDKESIVPGSQYDKKYQDKFVRALNDLNKKIEEETKKELSEIDMSAGSRPSERALAADAKKAIREMKQAVWRAAKEDEEKGLDLIKVGVLRPETPDYEKALEQIQNLHLTTEHPISKKSRKQIEEIQSTMEELNAISGAGEDLESRENAERLRRRLAKQLNTLAESDNAELLDISHSALGLAKNYRLDQSNKAVEDLKKEAGISEEKGRTLRLDDLIRDNMAYELPISTLENLQKIEGVAQKDLAPLKKDIVKYLDNRLNSAKYLANKIDSKSSEVYDKKEFTQFASQMHNIQDRLYKYLSGYMNAGQKKVYAYLAGIAQQAPVKVGMMASSVMNSPTLKTDGLQGILILGKMVDKLESIPKVLSSDSLTPKDKEKIYDTMNVLTKKYIDNLDKLKDKVETGKISASEVASAGIYAQLEKWFENDSSASNRYIDSASEEDLYKWFGDLTVNVAREKINNELTPEYEKIMGARLNDPTASISSEQEFIKKANAFLRMKGAAKLDKEATSVVEGYVKDVTENVQHLVVKLANQVDSLYTKFLSLVEEVPGLGEDSTGKHSHDDLDAAARTLFGKIVVLEKALGSFKGDKDTKYELSKEVAEGLGVGTNLTGEELKDALSKMQREVEASHAMSETIAGGLKPVLDDINNKYQKVAPALILEDPADQEHYAIDARSLVSDIDKALDIVGKGGLTKSIGLSKAIRELLGDHGKTLGSDLESLKRIISGRILGKGFLMDTVTPLGDLSEKALEKKATEVINKFLSLEDTDNEDKVIDLLRQAKALELKFLELRDEGKVVGIPESAAKKLSGIKDFDGTIPSLVAAIKDKMTRKISSNKAKTLGAAPIDWEALERAEDERSRQERDAKGVVKTASPNTSSDNAYNEPGEIDFADLDERQLNHKKPSGAQYQFLADQKNVTRLLGNTYDQVSKKERRKGLLENKAKKIVNSPEVINNLSNLRSAIKINQNDLDLKSSDTPKYDRLKAQVHAVRSHEKEIPKGVQIPDSVTKHMETIKKRWAGIHKKLQKHYEDLDKDLKRLEKLRSSDEGNNISDSHFEAVSKKHEHVKNRLKEHEDFDAAGASYSGDLAHQMQVDLHKEQLRLTSYLDKAIETSMSGKVKPGEARDHILELNRRLEHSLSKYRNQADHAADMLQNIEERIDITKSYLTRAKESEDGSGLTKGELEQWARLYLAQIMNWVMWVWNRNEDAFAQMVDSQPGDYEKFLVDHQQNLGIFNNARYSKAIIMTQDILKDARNKPGKYRSPGRKRIIEKLLRTRKQLFLYKYSIAHLYGLMDSIIQVAQEEFGESMQPNPKLKQEINSMNAGASKEIQNLETALKEAKAEGLIEPEQPEGGQKTASVQTVPVSKDRIQNILTGFLARG